ncbi:HD domain-containing protein [Cupriavidus agavae]|uniref:HD domain-containing protein n=2 Tax=Cupriavidus agavae TaxID=1001822 RepID=A0A4Q7R8C8_9BURK|nr:HD domain-containing protein [Cupriavidus agavae]
MPTTMYPNQFCATAQAAVGLAIAEATRQDADSKTLVGEYLRALYETLSHGHRCSRLMLAFAARLQDAVKGVIDPEAMAFGAFYHDVGKVCVPPEVLLAPRSLSPQEYKLIQAHTYHGRRIAELASSVVSQPNPALGYLHAMAACHHERWDGTGYPNRLSADDIPLTARMMAIVDTYDALRSSRAYKLGKSHEFACQVIEREIGNAFDPHIARSFLAMSKSFVDLFPELAIN